MVDADVGSQRTGEGSSPWTAIALLLAAASLALEWGWGLEWVVEQGAFETLRGIQAFASVVVVLDLFVALRRPVFRWSARGDRPAHGPLRRNMRLVIRRRWLEFMTCVPWLVGAWLGKPIEAMQWFLVLNLALGSMRMLGFLFDANIAPEVLLVVTFGLLVLVGTGALMLPRAVQHGSAPLSPVEALFTAVSAACVTGLSLRDTTHTFSGLGRTVIIVLIQFGGLGLVSVVAMLTVSTGRLFCPTQLGALRTLTSARALSDVRRVLVAIIGLTLGIELLGACAFYMSAAPEVLGGIGRVEWSVFHSVSAFCNGGFSIGEPTAEWLGTGGAPACILAGLVVLGSLGFPVLRELLPFGRAWNRSFERVHGPRRLRWLGLNSRAALCATGMLLVLGMVALWHSGLGLPEAGLLSVSSRTAGFEVVPFDDLTIAGRLGLELLMVVGGGAASTGGGVKTTTLVILLAAGWGLIRRHEGTRVFGWRVPTSLVSASVAVVVIYGIGLAGLTWGLGVLEEGLPLGERFFESISALSTVGLSCGVSQAAGTGGQLLLCAGMFFGRVGPLVVVILSLRRWGRGEDPVPSDRALLLG